MRSVKKMMPALILGILLSACNNQGSNQLTNKTYTMIKEKNGTVIDVRTTAEFMGGNVGGSINIPLQELKERVDEIRNMNQPLVLCCASGGRSGQAQAYLSKLGFDCHNGGSWMDVNYELNK